MADCDLAEIVQSMLALDSIFGASLRSAESTAISPEISRLYSAALCAWSLLLTLLPARYVYEISQT